MRGGGFVHGFTAQVSPCRMELCIRPIASRAMPHQGLRHYVNRWVPGYYTQGKWVPPQVNAPAYVVPTLASTRGRHFKGLNLG